MIVLKLQELHGAEPSWLISALRTRQMATIFHAHQSSSSAMMPLTSL